MRETKERELSMAKQFIPVEVFEDGTNVEPKVVSGIVNDFMTYQRVVSEVYHSPNMSPSSPTNNGEVSE
jgi:hypothetical protein